MDAGNEDGGDVGVTKEDAAILMTLKHGTKRKRRRAGSTCEHGRQRHRCKECGGSQICEHGRRRSRCKECGGSEICEHGRMRSQCKECGGGSICEHGRRRSRCKECGGSGISTPP